MKVKLIAHTALSEEFERELWDPYYDPEPAYKINPRAGLALTAIRTCYSEKLPSEILKAEGAKYFGQDATDGEDGSEADRLFRHITRSGHTSTLEHISYSFALEGVSRSLLAQLTRHRAGFSFSVQSQRYVRFGSGDKSGGFDYVTPQTVAGNDRPVEITYGKGSSPSTVEDLYDHAMQSAQWTYDALRQLGVPAEDARFVLPNAASCNLVMTANLRALLEFYGKRQKGKGAQWEIANLADQLRFHVVTVDPWTKRYFNQK